MQHLLHSREATLARLYESIKPPAVYTIRLAVLQERSARRCANERTRDRASAGNREASLRKAARVCFPRQLPRRCSALAQWDEERIMVGTMMAFLVVGLIANSKELYPFSILLEDNSAAERLLHTHT